MKWPQPILRQHVTTSWAWTTLRTDRHDSSQQTATVYPCNLQQGETAAARDEGSWKPLAKLPPWQPTSCVAHPLETYKLHTNNGEDFPLSTPQKSISPSKFTPSKHQLATPSNIPVQSVETEIRWLHSPGSSVGRYNA